MSCFAQVSSSRERTPPPASASGTPPSLDCGGQPCVAVAAASPGLLGTIDLTGTLYTAATDTTPVVIAVISVSGLLDTINSPTVGSTTMTSLCSNTGVTPQIAVYYETATVPGTGGATVTESATGEFQGDAGTMVAFAISGAATTGTITDVACATNSGSGTSPSAIVSGFAYSDDFIFAGFATLAPPLTSPSPNTEVGNTGTSQTGLGGAAIYQSGSSASSYTFSYTSGSGAYTTATAAIKSASPTPVPLFPEGIVPILLAVPIVYFVGRRRHPRISQGRPVS